MNLTFAVSGIHLQRIATVGLSVVSLEALGQLAITVLAVHSTRLRFLVEGYLPPP